MDADDAQAADVVDVDVSVAEGPDPADVDDDDDDDDDEFEWIQGWSTEYNVYYYFHVPTGTTSWEAPETYKPYSPDDDGTDARATFYSDTIPRPASFDPAIFERSVASAHVAPIFSRKNAFSMRTSPSICLCSESLSSLRSA